MRGLLLSLAAVALAAHGPAIAVGGKVRFSAPQAKAKSVWRDALKPASGPDEGCPAGKAEGPAGAGPGYPVPDQGPVMTGGPGRKGGPVVGPGPAAQDRGGAAEWRPPPIPPLRDAACGQAASGDGQGQAEWRPPPIPPLK